MTTDEQREEDIALSIDHALTAALTHWVKLHGHLVSGQQDVNIAVGAVIGFAAGEAAGIRSPLPFREQFIREVTHTFEIGLREACEMLDTKGKVGYQRAKAEGEEP